MVHGRIFIGRATLLVPALGPGAAGVVQVPVPGLGQEQALGGLQAERIDVGGEHQQAGETLATLDDAELGRLLDRVDGVAAGIGEPDDLGFGSLRLQQERREVVGVERVAHLAEHFAAVLFHHRRGVALERIAEGIVGREEEPGVATRLHHRLAGAVGQHPGVIGPVHGVGIALRPGEVGGCRAGDDEHLVLGGGDLAHRQRHARIRHVDDDVDLVDVVPLVGDLRTDIRFVLMVAADQLDLHIRIGLGEVGDRHFGGGDRAGAGGVRIKARHVGEHADLDVDLLGTGGAAGQ